MMMTVKSAIYVKIVKSEITVAIHITFGNTKIHKKLTKYRNVHLHTCAKKKNIIV